MIGVVYLIGGEKPGIRHGTVASIWDIATSTYTRSVAETRPFTVAEIAAAQSIAAGDTGVKNVRRYGSPG